MGLTDQFNEGKKWVAEKFVFNSNTDVSVFETVIRFVGGFISGMAVREKKTQKNVILEIVVLSVTISIWVKMSKSSHKSHLCNCGGIYLMWSKKTTQKMIVKFTYANKTNKLEKDYHQPSHSWYNVG